MTNKLISYEGYLIEEKLGIILKQIFPEVEPQKRFGRYKVDYFIPSIKSAVEFNGYKHYSSPKQIIRDYILKEKLKQENIELLEIPYWLQFDESICEWLFKDKIDTSLFTFDVKYKHGFIDDKAMLPAEFCQLGWDRFTKEYASFIQIDRFSIMAEIYSSLQNKIKQLGNILLVLPPIHKSFISPKDFIENYPT